MEVNIKLVSLEVSDWFEKLSVMLENQKEIEISQPNKMPGALGAFQIPNIKAKIKTIAQLAAIITCIVQLYSIGKASDTPRRCDVRFKKGNEIVRIIVPCRDTQPEELLEIIIPQLKDVQENTLSDIEIEPAQGE